MISQIISTRTGVKVHLAAHDQEAAHFSSCSSLQGCKSRCRSMFNGAMQCSGQSEEDDLRSCAHRTAYAPSHYRQPSCLLTLADLCEAQAFQMHHVATWCE